MPLPLPDPYIVLGDPGKEYADGPGTQRNLEALARAAGTGFTKNADTAVADIVIGGGNISTAAADPQSINGSSGITAVNRQSIGRYRVTLPFNVSTTANLWPVATVADNAGWFCQCVPVGLSFASYDIYVFTAAGALTDGRTISTTYVARRSA